MIQTRTRPRTHTPNEYIILYMYMNMNQWSARHNLYRFLPIYIGQAWNYSPNAFIKPCRSLAMSENDSKESHKRDSIKNVRHDMDERFESFKEELLEAVATRIQDVMSNKTDTTTVSTPSNEVSSSTSKIIEATDVEVMEFHPKCVVARPSDRAIYNETGKREPDMNKIMVKFGQKVPRGSAVEKWLMNIASLTGGRYHTMAKMMFEGESFTRKCPAISYKQAELPENLEALLTANAIQIQGEA